MTVALLQETVYTLAGANDAVYAGRATGLYRSRDSGATWENTFESLGQREPLAATAVAAIGQTVFAGVKGAVLRSEDDGETWQIGGLASPAPLVVALAISPDFANDGMIAAGTAEDGVFLSTDRGETWVAWNFGLIDLNVYALAISPDFAQDRTLYAGTESGVFRSRNGGRGWHEVPFPMQYAPVLSLAISAGAVYAGTEQHGLWVSENHGEHWQQISGTSAAVNGLYSADSGVWALMEDRLVRACASCVSETMIEFPKTAMTAWIAPGSVLVGFDDGKIVSFSV